MFLATVILLLGYIEITSSSLTVQICSVFISFKHAHDGSVVRTAGLQTCSVSTPAAIW